MKFKLPSKYRIVQGYDGKFEVEERRFFSYIQCLTEQTASGIWVGRRYNTYTEAHNALIAMINFINRDAFRSAVYFDRWGNKLYE